MNEKKKIIDFIHGELLWNELEKAGIEINIIDDDHYEITSKNIIVKPELSDISIGILKLYEMPNAIRRWATIIVGSPIIDLGNIEINEHGDDILNLLWDLSGGIEINSMQLDLVKQINEHAH